MNSFEGHPIIIQETRYQELVAKEKQLAQILGIYPELESGGKKLTPMAKKYKEALKALCDRVNFVLSSPEFERMIAAAGRSGVWYEGPAMGEPLEEAGKLLATRRNL